MPLYSPDSVTYLSSGLNLATGQGLRDFALEPLTLFPPGLPVLVAICHWLGLSGSATIRLLNAASFGASVWLSFVLLRRHLSSRVIVLGLTALVALSTPLLAINVEAWTEPLFVVIVLGFLYALERALEEGGSLGWLLAAVGLTWAGFLLRYAGITLVVLGAVALVLGGARWRQLGRWALGGAFGLAGALVPVAWMLRNYSIDRTLMGQRDASSTSVHELVREVVLTLEGWVLPVPGSAGAQRDALEALVILVLAGSIFVLLARRGAAEPPGAARPASLVPLATFLVGYGAYLVAAKLRTPIDALDTRLLSPLLVPGLIALGVLADRVSTASRPPLRSWLRGAGLVLLALVLISQATSFVRTWRATRFVSRSAAAAPLSPLTRAALALKPGAPIYTDTPESIWLGGHRQPLYFSPEQHPYQSTGTEPIPAAFLRAAACRTGYLAWYEATPRSYLYTPEQLSRDVTLTPVATEPDGTLYRLGPLAGSTAACPSTGG
jgi:hypothetical protein